MFGFCSRCKIMGPVRVKYEPIHGVCAFCGGAFTQLGSANATGADGMGVPGATRKPHILADHAKSKKEQLLAELSERFRADAF